MSDVFDYEKDKLHETSNYSLPEDAFTNVTTRAPTITKTTYGGGATKGNPYKYNGYNANSIYNDDYYDYYSPRTSGSSVNTGYAEVYRAKVKLLASINTFNLLYTIDEVKLFDLVETFCEYIETETKAFNIPANYDCNKLEDSLTACLNTFQLTCDSIAQDIIEYEEDGGVTVSSTVLTLPSPEIKEINFKTLDMNTLNAEQNLAFNDGQDSAQLGLHIDEALRWYSFTNDLIPYFKAGYNEATSRLSTTP